jgi:copper resistance protein C
VIVVDASGRDWADGAPVLAGDAVTVPLEPGMPDAGYEVRWRVVSSDGHPIAGLIPFTIGDAAPLERTAAEAPSSEDTGAQSTDQIAQESSDATRVLLIGGAGAAVAVAVFATLSLLRRRRARAPGIDGRIDPPSNES